MDRMSRLKGTLIPLLAILSLVWLASSGIASGRRDGTGGDSHGSQGNPGVVPPNAVAFGKSYAEWGAAWWQWALTNPCATSVIFDPDGEFCAANQSGPVWFLAGGASTTRSCAVPAGKFLFFPLINVINDYPCPDTTFHPAFGQTLEDFLTIGAKSFIDPTTTLKCEIDGRSLVDLFAYRATSHLFTFTGNADLATCFDPCITGSPQQAVADGYWLMISPLSAGAHSLHFQAIGAFTQEETYHLTVSGGGTSAGPAAATDAKHPTWGKLKTLYR